MAWTRTHQVWSAILLLGIIVVTGLRVTHRRSVMQRLQEFVEDLAFTPADDTYTIATVEVGQSYPITVAHKEISFLVKSNRERLAVFEVVVTPVNPAETTPQGAKAHGWVFKINRVSTRPPALYASPIAAAYAMEKHFSVGNSEPAHA